MLYLSETYEKSLGSPRFSILLEMGQQGKQRRKSVVFLSSPMKNEAKMKKKPVGNMILLVIFIFVYVLLCPSVWAASFFDIPSDYGMVKEEFGYAADSGDNKTLIYIQDAHCNFEAQKNIANILEHLIREKGIKMVFVEGGVEDSSLSFLRGYGSKEARRSIAEKYLKEGKISGEEYLNIISDLPFEVYGIEDSNLYDEHVNSFLQVDEYREELIKFIDKVALINAEIKQRIYSAELREFETKRKDYEEGKSEFIKYAEYLAGLCLEHDVSLDNFRNFSKLSEAILLEKDIDYALIGQEANSVLNRLSEVMQKEKFSKVLDKAKSLEGKEQKQVYDFYQEIRELAEKEGVDLRYYPNFNGFSAYLVAFDLVGAEDMFYEINSVNRAVAIKLMTSSDQWEVFDIEQGLGLFKKIATLKLNKEDFDFYLQKKELVNPQGWVSSLTKLAARYNIGIRTPSNAVKVEGILKELGHFYQLAFQRDNKFVENIFSKMEKENIDKAVLITGGFHSQNLQKLLEQGGAIGIIVYPKVSGLSDDELYSSRVRGELSDLERWVSNEDTTYGMK